MAFAISRGELARVEQPLLQAPYSVRLADDLSRDYAEIYRTQQAVRTVVSFLARNVASLGMHVFERISDTDRERVTDHPLPRLLGRPNPRTTTYRLFEALVSDIGIYDQAFWLKYLEAGEPRLQRIPPKFVKPKGDDWLSASAFVIEGSRGKVEILAERIVHFHGYNPVDDRVGSPPIESLRQTLAEEYDAQLMRAQIMRNGARASGYIERPAGSKWSDEAFDRFRESWRSQYTGNGPEAGGTPILEDGMVFKAAAQTAKDLQYLEVRKLTREEVASAYHIPPPMIGILERATFSNIQEQHKMLYQDTLGPILEMIQQEIELQLLPDLEQSRALYVEFNLAAKLRGSFEEQAAAASTSTGRPWMSVNEQRARFNLPAIDGGDDLVIPLNVLVGGQASPRDSAPDGALSGFRVPGKVLAISRHPHGDRVLAEGVKSKATDAERERVRREYAKFFRRQAQAVRSRLGAKAGDDWWQEERWNEELAAVVYALSFSTSQNVARRALEAGGLDPDSYDPEMTLNYLKRVSESTAESMNIVTKQQLDAALESEEPLEEVTRVFEKAEESRSEQSSQTLVTFLAGFATVEAFKQAAPGAEPVKTWIVTSANPRESHAAVNGQTVPLESTFSNGAKWPGDPILGVDGIAGCTCEVQVLIP